jgi:hypothetical protein
MERRTDSNEYENNVSKKQARKENLRREKELKLNKNNK